MAASRPVLGLIALVLLAGALLFEFFIILSGAVNSYPENTIYFFWAETTGIEPQPRNPSVWTYFSICTFGSNGRTTDCGDPVPALPFDPPHRHNFNTINGVPEGFIGAESYFLLSRFAWVFFLLALLFSAFALFTGLLALCSRLGGYISAFNTFIALTLQTVAAALMTSWTVRARNEFREAGLDAGLGTRGYGFSWGAVGCLFLATLLFCLSGTSRRDKDTYGEPKKRGLFGKKRADGFENGDGTRGKDEYP